MPKGGARDRRRGNFRWSSPGSLEAKYLPARAGDLLGEKVHIDPARCACIAQIRSDRFDRLGREADRDDAAAKAVAVEDVAETRRDDGAKSALAKRSRRGLARGAATEIGAGHEDFGMRPGLAIEDEIRIRRAVGFHAPFSKQAVAQALLGGAREKPRRDDLVGVDVVAHERHCQTGMTDEGFHGPVSSRDAGRR